MHTKPTPEQITQHFENIARIEDLLEACLHFMEAHIPNPQERKIYADLQRLPKKIEAVKLSFMTLLREQA